MFRCLVERPELSIFEGVRTRASPAYAAWVVRWLSQSRVPQIPIEERGRVYLDVPDWFQDLGVTRGTLVELPAVVAY